MPETPDQKFHSQLQDKVFKANSNDRAKQTKEITDKLEEIKPKDFPEKVKMELVNEPNDLAKAFFSMLKGEKGEQGEQGKRGEQGEKGETGERGKDGKDGLRGLKGDRGEKGKDGKDGLDGKDGKDGRDGKDASEEKILEKLKKREVHIKEVKGVNEVLHEVGNNFLQQAKSLVPRSLSGMYDVNTYGLVDGQTLIWKASQQKWIPGTATGGTGGYIVETPTGTIDGNNTSFTVSAVPVYIVSDGTTYFANNGYTISGLNITMSVAPTGYIRSFHL